MILKNKILTKVFSIAIFFILLFNFINFVPVLAADYGLTDTVNSVGENKPSDWGKEVNISTKIGTVVGAALALIGVLFFILMIYGGFLWMTARGDEGQAGKAKDLITAAVIGLVIVLSAYAITSWLGTQLTTSTSTT